MSESTARGYLGRPIETRQRIEYAPATGVAVQYDPVTHGDLGWFPRGYLLDKKLEEIAFSLQPEAYSEVIETLAGYHILQVLEREAQRPLTPEALLAQQVQAVQDWLNERRSQTEIQILLP